MDLTEEMQKYQRVLREYKEDICVSCHEPYTARDDDPVIGMCLACGEWNILLITKPTINKMYGGAILKKNCLKMHLLSTSNDMT